MKQAFTLIELLVVIAIIGVISTLSVVSFSSARERARIAKGASFEASVHRFLGSEAIGVWSFDEGSGTVSTADFSGAENTGSLINITEANWVAGQRGNALDFATGRYVDIPTISIASFQNSFTWMGWVKTSNYSGGWGWPFSSSIYGGHWIQCGKKLGDGNIRFDLQTALDTTNVNIADNKWHHLACVFDGENKYIYVDGALKASAPVTLTFTINSDYGHLLIGAHPGPGEYWTGQLDEIRVYTAPLTAEQIRENYFTDSGLSPLASRP